MSLAQLKNACETSLRARAYVLSSVYNSLESQLVIAKRIQTTSSVFGLTDSVTHRMYSIANPPSCAYDANFDKSDGIEGIF